MDFCDALTWIYSVLASPKLAFSEHGLIYQHCPLHRHPFYRHPSYSIITSWVHLKRLSNFMNAVRVFGPCTLAPVRLSRLYCPGIQSSRIGYSQSNTTELYFSFPCRVPGTTIRLLQPASPISNDNKSSLHRKHWAVINRLQIFSAPRRCGFGSMD